jgi:hypothetical protein
MKAWQIRHRLFHQLFQGEDLGDDLSKFTVIEEHSPDDIVRRALEYPVIQRPELYYPGKAYCVAVTFAKLLEIHFGEDFHECLRDPMLLYENPPFHKTYDEDPQTYERIISRFPWHLITDRASASPDFQKTLEYFELEFLLHEKTRMFAPEN